ncbi:LLM class flavin-dependent oxidoreductase [soil metagenome]
MANAPAPRFGVWALVNGSWASFRHPDDPLDASWQRNRKLIVEAESLGFASTLIAQQTINPWGDEFDQLEAWTAAAALAEATKAIEIIIAIKPALFHPVVLAKQALQIHEISQGRAAINLVNGWFKPEIERAGLPFLEHDARYDYGGEWIDIVRDLIAGRRVNFKGRYFEVKDYQLRPGAWQGERPVIYIGGESEPARALAARTADCWFMNGRPLADIEPLITDLNARCLGRQPMRFGMAAFVIACATDAQATEAHAAAVELGKQDGAETGFLAANADPAVVMQQQGKRYANRVGTNGGTAAGLVGSYDTVAQRIVEFNAAGIETFMLQFQPFEEGMRRFAHEVIPRVERLRRHQH